MDMSDSEESKDFLGRTYEYCIQLFAAYEGVNGGKFYTLASIAKTIVVKSEKFSEIMQSSLNAYLNGMLTNEEFIEEVLKLAKQIATAQKEPQAWTYC